MYRMFNFYIPMVRILFVSDTKKHAFTNFDVYEQTVEYVTSNFAVQSIISLCEANETVNSHCEIVLDKAEIIQTIREALDSDEKTNKFKKLENRVMNEIISHVNLSEIDIEEGLYRNETHDFKRKARQKKRNENSQILMRRDSTPKKVPHSMSLERPDEGDRFENRSSNAKLSQIDVEIEEDSKSEEREIDDDFLDLQMTVDEDVSTWNQVYTSDEVIVFKKKTEGTPMVLIKAIATLRDIPKKIVFKAIYDTNIRQEWDKLFHHFEVVEHDEETKRTVLYYVIKAPLGISNRDFLQQRKVIFDFPTKGVTYMHFKSIEHPEKPLVKGIVRAETIISGYIIEQIQDDPPITQLTVISQNDIKGLIPKYLVNLASGKAPKQW
eukprot:CAMPEP_0168351002 /NCGR_PEP_ID=MMETSP0213-20121227/21525_1 /TAXON_ID=151035 /ORGANISM="Euplotes harpa, Strain FSP1.4" /LENGTH=380 /DNA_ID=CAMNT_0008361597 /DNA_START=1 /DNA_END=1140 /DNA_ORIENTATION=-